MIIKEQNSPEQNNESIFQCDIHGLWLYSLSKKGSLLIWEILLKRPPGNV